MSIASEISRLQNSKADVKTIVNKDKDLINSGTAFIDDETVDDYDDKIEEMQEAYKKFIPIQTTSGTEIQLDNTNDDKILVNIGLDGNTEQQTYSGYNLLDNSKLRQGSGADTTTLSRCFIDGNYYLTAGTYTIVSNVNTSTYKYAVGINTQQYPNTTGSVVFDTGWITTSYSTFTLISAGYLGVGIATLDGGGAVSPSSLSSSWFMVYSGNYDSSKTYEPYVGGIASPNPSYPQDVNVVTGNNTVTVMGLNLLDESTLRQGGFNNSSTTNRLFFNANNYLTAGTYTLVTTLNVSNYRYGVDISTKTFPLSNASEINVYDSGWLTTTYHTFTISNDGYVGVAVSKSNGSDNLTPSDISDAKFMIYAGSYDSTKTYTPYQSQSYPINLASENLLDESTLAQGSFMNVGQLDRLYFYSNYYLVAGTYTLLTDLSSPFRYAINVASGTFPRATIDIANPGWSTSEYSTFTINQNGYFGLGISKSDGSNIVPSDISSYHFMLYKGSYDSSITYEPYWQIELAKISTYKDKLNRSIGKNQFDGVMESGGISGTTGQDEDLANRIRSKNKIPIEGKTLTISCSQTNKKLHVYFYEADQTFIGHTDAWKDFPYTFTVASNVKYVRLLVKNSNDSSIQPTDITNIQIEKGSSATSPEPYGKGKWYKYENIGKKVLNGSETINSISNNRFQIALSPSAGDGYSTLIEVCNIFRPITQLEISSTSKEYVVAVNSGYIYIRATSSTTEAQLRTILSNTNANVYYIKAIPTITEITDTTLIGQLEAIHFATGTNVIEFSGGTLVSQLDVNYIGEANPHL